MGISPTVARLLLIMILAFPAFLPAAGRDKSDAIVLKNGDKVSGEILTLDRGILTFKTDSMGTLEIKWEDVERITSKYLFTVEDTIGRHFVGSLQAAAEPRRVDVFGPKPAIGLNHIVIVGIREFEGSLWNRFSGAVELGYTFTKASDRTQFNVTSDLAYRAERSDGSLAYDSIISTSKGEQDVDRKVLTLRGSRYIGRKWLFFPGKVGTQPGTAARSSFFHHGRAGIQDLQEQPLRHPGGGRDVVHP